MVNELGISRDDIKEWTIQAVKEAVEKELRGLHLEDVARSVAKQRLESIYNHDYQKNLVSEAIGDVVRKTLSISIRLKEDKNVVN
jgi:ribonucleotide reductase alpha subunit